ncbi:MAG: B12-binding domain-containing radical SAM protein [Candidatus Omnitrophica bacterium]|nr:B12-binding domain-containing radical SAM protein [Candidatus Omnitrophota bacterium]
MEHESPHILLILCPPFWTKLPPLGLAYLSSFLQYYGYNVIIRDLNISFYHKAAENVQKRWLVSEDISFQDNFFTKLLENIPDEIEQITDDVVRQQFTIVGFSVFRSNRIFSLQLAKRIRSKAPHIKIIFGGPEMMALRYGSSFWNADDIRNVVDGVIIGEGERGFMDAVNGVSSGKALPFIIHAEECHDLDCLPPPTYKGFDLSLYDRKRALPFLTSRGCVRRCEFCAERLLFHSFRIRSPQNIVGEIEEHQDKRNIVWFTFHDSLINGNVALLRRWCQLLVERNIKIKWEAQAAIRDDMDSDLLRLMKQAGCFNLFVGLESGSSRVVRLMNKGYTPEVARRFFQKCKDADLHCEVSLIVGFPGEGDEEFLETVSFLEENKTIIPKIAQVNAFQLLAGTPIARKLYAGEHMDVFARQHDRSLKRVNYLIKFLKEHAFSYTPAFIGNLVHERPY